MDVTSIIFFTIAFCLTACYGQSTCHARLGSSCYYFSQEGDTRDRAEKVCQKMKGHLVTIDSQREQKFLHIEVMHRGAAGYWIGLEATRNKYLDQTGWKWQQGGAYVRNDLANWGDRKPNDSDGRENCVIYSKELGYLWDDVPCFTQYGYICEMRI